MGSLKAFVMRMAECGSTRVLVVNRTQDEDIVVIDTLVDEMDLMRQESLRDVFVEIFDEVWKKTSLSRPEVHDWLIRNVLPKLVPAPTPRRAVQTEPTQEPAPEPVEAQPLPEAKIVGGAMGELFEQLFGVTP